MEFDDPHKTPEEALGQATPENYVVTPHRKRRPGFHNSPAQNPPFVPYSPSYIEEMAIRSRHAAPYLLDSLKTDVLRHASGVGGGSESHPVPPPPSPPPSRLHYPEAPWSSWPLPPPQPPSRKEEPPPIVPHVKSELILQSMLWQESQFYYSHVFFQLWNHSKMFGSFRCQLGGQAEPLF